MEYVKAHPSRVGLERNWLLSKSLSLQKFPGQLPMIQLLQGYVELYKIWVVVHYGTRHHLVYTSKNIEENKVIHIQSLAGVHYNLCITLNRFDLSGLSPQEKRVSEKNEVSVAEEV